MDNKKQSKKAEMDEGENQEKLKKVIQGWLAKARNPASRLEAELKAAEEKIKQLEHEKKEESKIAEIIQEEHVAKIEQYEKIIMMMASEIKKICMPARSQSWKTSKTNLRMRRKNFKPSLKR